MTTTDSLKPFIDLAIAVIAARTDIAVDPKNTQTLVDAWHKIRKGENTPLKDSLALFYNDNAMAADWNRTIANTAITSCTREEHNIEKLILFMAGWCVVPTSEKGIVKDIKDTSACLEILESAIPAEGANLLTAPAKTGKSPQLTATSLCRLVAAITYSAEIYNGDVNDAGLQARIKTQTHTLPNKLGQGKSSGPVVSLNHKKSGSKLGKTGFISATPIC